MAKRSRRWRRSWLLAVALVALAAISLGLTGAALARSGDGAPPRVSVAGVDVSGLSDEEVREIAAAELDELRSETIVLTSPDAPTFELSVEKGDLIRGADLDAAVEEAATERGSFGNLMARIGLASRREVTVEPVINRNKVDSIVENVAGQLSEKPARGATVVRSGDGFAVKSGTSGVGVDPLWLEARLAELPDSIEIPLGPHDAPISDAAAARAVEVANRATSGPVSVTQGPYGFPLDRALLRSAVEFVPDAPDLLVRLDGDILAEKLRPAFASREVDAADARFQPVANGVEIVPEQAGRRLDVQAIGRAIVQRPAGVKSVKARYEVIRPRRRTADLEALDVNDLVGEFTTEFTPGEPRVTNIQRGAALLDGAIIKKGETFSLNTAIGERTEERGFVPAPEISGAELDEGVGGGVSQIATTFFNAAFFAGLEIVEHRPHSFYISRYPEGREATISWGGPDVVVVNDWPSNVLVDSQTSDSAITVRLYSNSDNRKVESETGERTDFEDPEIVERAGDDLAPGERRFIQDPGSSGFSISYSRKVYKGSNVKRDETFRWTYQPQDGIIEIGGFVPEPEEPDEGAQTTAPEDAPPE
jgi:vancomycin resistance protein YoaR